MRTRAQQISNQQSAISASGDAESAAKYLFKLSRDVILSLDRIGNILCINQRGVQLSGYSESELRGANVFERLLLPEDEQVVREVLADLLEGKARHIKYAGEQKMAPLSISTAYQFHASQTVANFCLRFAPCEM